MNDLKVEPNASNIPNNKIIITIPLYLIALMMIAIYAILKFFISITWHSEIYSTAAVHELENPLPMTIVSLEKIELSKSEIELTVGQTSEITTSVFPENATDKNIKLKSSNERIVTIDNSVITAISNGTAKIIAENEATGIQSICNIVVKKPYVPEPKPANQKYYVDGVPFINQYHLGYPTGCEAVSATMAAKYAGYNVDVKTIIEHTPTDPLGKRQETRTIEKQVEVLNQETNENELVTTKEEVTTWVAENPFEFFVGHPSKTTASGSYGCYAKPIVTALNASGVSCTNISGCSIDTLYMHIRQGKPVIIWCRINGKDLKTGVTWQYPDGSGEYSELIGEHCAVLVGYDNNKVYLNDPIAGKGVSQSKSKFESNWYKLFSQAIIIN